jgi:DNA-binding IscR family transcriptional regulator
MRVSLRSTYGIMAAVDMAMQTGSAPVQAKSIARRQGIPARFLEQVLHAMKKAGLVLSPLFHGINGRLGPRTKSDPLLAKIWTRVGLAEREVLQGITVEELAGQQREIEEQRTLMYHI